MKKSILFKTVILFLFCFGYTFNLSAQLSRVVQYYSSLEKKYKQNPQEIQFVNDSMSLVEDYTKLSQIILLRHGEPALEKNGWRKRKEAEQYIISYDTVGIYTPTFIPIVIGQNDVSIIYTSSINRSIHTAKLVFNREDIQLSNSIFREFERKIVALPNIKLPLKWWLTTSRILWFMRLNTKGIENVSEAKARAKKGASFLHQDAINNGKTLLVSHGLLNHYLVKYLEKEGWVEVFDGGKGYLSQKVLVKYNDD